MREGDAIRLQQMAALIIAGIIMYVPANVLPVMSTTITGEVQHLTIIGGVYELYITGIAPIAIIVFLASIMVPFCKLGSLTWLLLMHGQPHYRRQRTVLLRFLRMIGSWSMIDLFLLSILVAVGQLGMLASVQAEPGALFFAGVLVVSLFAADIYETRMIWQDDEIPTT
jgi:paraquat-inducible protein A